MINWPKPNEYAFDRNGFKKLVQNILVNKVVLESDECQQKLTKWNQIKIEGISTIDSVLLKELIREGIPDSLRKDVWPLLVKDGVPDFSTILGQPLNQKIVKLIDLDVERTFKNNIFFSNNESCSRGLKRVLTALCIILPQMGYCQGLNYIVATSLLRLPQQDSFNQIYYILRGKGHGKLLMNMTNISRNLFVFDRLIQKHFKQFFHHLQKYQIDSCQYCMNWFITIFCACLPFQYTLRIIQLYLSQGKKILFRVALTIIKYKKHKAKSLKSFEDILIYLKNSDDFQSIPASEFIKEMFSFNISRKQLDTLQTTYTNKD